MATEEHAPANQLQRLRAALERLAAPAADQRYWLTEHHGAQFADQLAADFDAALELVHLGGPAPIPPAAASKLQLLEAQLALMSTLEDVWDISALATDAQWRRVRALASESLHALPIAV